MGQPVGLSSTELESIVQFLDQAILDHSQWLEQWHRSLVCESPLPAKMVLEEDAHRRCAFGLWYHSQTAPILVENPTFLRLRDLHEQLHELARELYLSWTAEQTISETEYDAFVACEREFSRNLIQLDGQSHELLSAFDSLTGVMNRQTYLRVLAQERARVNRTGQPCCFALLDLDHFKRINDTHGHLAGDRVLRTTAQFLAAHLRPYDSIFRFGGDEFLIALPNTPLALAEAILKRLCKGLESIPMDLDDGRRIRIAASIGVAVMTPQIPIKEAIAQADKALYEAKHGGRNQLKVFKAEG